MRPMDWVVLIAYFVVLLAIGLWASSKTKKGSQIGRAHV